MLIRLCGCAGWSASLLFALGINSFFSWHGSFGKHVSHKLKALARETELRSISQTELHSISQLHSNFSILIFKCPIFPVLDVIGPVYKTNLVRTKSLSDHGADQIWLCKRYLSVPKIWSGLRVGPTHVQGPRSDRIWSGTKSGYVNAPCSSDQTKSSTLGGKSQSSNKNCESATWCKLINRWKLDYYKNL